MKIIGRPDNAQAQSLGCPVCGREVTCRVSYDTRPGKRALSYFECCLEGLCGISSWDPCPVYTRLLEQTPAP